MRWTKTPDCMNENDGIGKSGEHVEVLLAQGRHIAPDGAEVPCALESALGTDLLPQLHHADVALGLVIVAWHIEVADESQLVSALGVETS